MNICIAENEAKSGEKAAHYCTDLIHKAIQLKGKARLAISAVASQSTTLKALAASPIDWSKVEIFQTSEFIGLPVNHSHSFQHHLYQHFIQMIPSETEAVHAIHGETTEIEAAIIQLTEELRPDSIDLALVSIGDNASIAFNDPPANFTAEEAYHVVNLDLSSKMELVRDGRFHCVKEVPEQVITMTVHQIMQSEHIVTCEPRAVKAYAVMATIEYEVSPKIPASILKQHPSWHLFLDEASASETSIA
jgi:glucosamine-6-phosphate deaminase